MIAVCKELTCWEEAPEGRNDGIKSDWSFIKVFLKSLSLSSEWRSLNPDMDPITALHGWSNHGINSCHSGTELEVMGMWGLANITWKVPAAQDSQLQCSVVFCAPSIA